MKYLIRQGIMSFRTIRKTCATTVWQLAAGKNKDVESCRRLGGLLQALQHRAAPVSEERRRDWRVEIHHYRAVMARSFLQRLATDVHVWRFSDGRAQGGRAHSAGVCFLHLLGDHHIVPAHIVSGHGHCDLA